MHTYYTNKFLLMLLLVNLVLFVRLLHNIIRNKCIQQTDFRKVHLIYCCVTPAAPYSISFRRKSYSIKHEIDRFDTSLTCTCIMQVINWKFDFWQQWTSRVCKSSYDHRAKRFNHRLNNNIIINSMDVKQINNRLDKIM